ncbi:MAG: hypothetical protein AAFR55_09055, partial [Pseudomonadota bacterium]
MAFAIIAVGLLASPAARADDEWQPFAKPDSRAISAAAARDRAARRRNAARPPSEERQPTAPPLASFNDGDRPWLLRDRSGGRTPGSDPAAGYLPPPTEGAPVDPSSSAVTRRELAPLVIPNAAPSPAPEPATRGPVQNRPTERAPNLRSEPPVRTAVTTVVRPQRDATQPVASAPKSVMSGDIWGDIAFSDLATLLQAAPTAFGSPTVRTLFLSALQASPLGDRDLATGAPKLAALRAAAVYDRGLLDAATLTADPSTSSRTVAPTAAPASDPTRLAALVGMLETRAALARGTWQAACPRIRAALSNPTASSKPVLAQLLMQGGVCAAFAKTEGGAALGARLARDAGYERAITLTLLDTVGGDPASSRGLRGQRLLRGARLDAIDVRLAQLANISVPPSAIPDLEPSGVAALADGKTDDVVARILAAERGARANIIAPAALADAYRASDRLRRADPSLPATDRAQLFVAIEGTRAMLQRARLIRNFLDLARKDDLYLAAARLAADATRDLRQVAEIGWFAETAIEVALADGDTETARAWANMADRLDGARRGAFDHWRALIALSDPRSGRAVERHLGAVERAAVARRFKAGDLHIVATVLDALDFQVPIGLWEAANATPQPNSGHLPPTGTLKTLADAAK